jgi:DNA topoisomerase-3
VERKERSEPPPQFFNLNDLQKEANRRHGLTAQATLDAAQALYEEHKLITYPRTDSRHVTRALAATFPERLAALAACPDYAPLVPEAPQKPGSRYVDDAKVTDHHAILPTAVAPDLSALKPRERLVYDLVARRFLAAFYPPARWEDAAAVTAVGDLKFLSRGRVQIEPGWRAVLPEPAAARGRAEEGEEAPEEAGALPPLREGEEVRISGARAEERQTQPPPRYTEASLLAAMENAGRFLDDRELQEAMRGHGLGTPATRAAIIERLIEVGYVERRGRTLVPTPKGEVLVSLVPEELRSPEMTARWERMLAEIEEGRRRPESFLQGIVELTERVVNHVREQERAETGGARAALGRCPLCGKDVVEQKKSYSCSGWKEGCSFTIWKEIAGKKVTPKQAQSLLEKGRTGVLQGFRSRAGKAFSAALVLKDGRVEFEFPEGGVRAGGGRGGARSGRR